LPKTRFQAFQALSSHFEGVSNSKETAVAVILKVLLVNLLAALNFAVFKNKKTFGK